MAPHSEAQVVGRLRICAVCLCMLATWTFVIKFLNPICLYLAEVKHTGSAIGPHIMWDFWWVPHLWLAIWLWQRQSRAWELGIVVAAVEIVIITIKFALFLQNPLAPRSNAAPVLDTFFSFTWFVNKVFVLGFFIFLVTLLLRPECKAVLRQRPVAV